MLILGIESSCDETAAAVVKDGSEVISSVIASQAALHAQTQRWAGFATQLETFFSQQKLELFLQIFLKSIFEKIKKQTVGVKKPRPA